MVLSELTQEKVVETMRGERFVMLTSVAPDGKLQSHPMTPQQITHDADVWFFINGKADQATNLMEHPEVNAAFAEAGSWLSVAGRVLFDNHNRAKIDELWDDSVAAYFDGGKSDPGLALVRFVCESAQFWGQPGGKVASLAQIAKAKVTGDRPAGTSDTTEL